MSDSMRDMMNGSVPETNIQWGKMAQGAAFGYVLGEQIKGLNPQQGEEAYYDPNTQAMYFGPSRAQILWFKIKVILVWAAILGALFWWFFIFEA